MSTKLSPPITFATCLARSPKTLQQCPAAAEEGSKWCARHEEHEGKQLKIYKKISSDYHDFDDSVLCNDVKRILACTDMKVLKAWHAGAKAKWKLGHRTLRAREQHHVSFYGGGDQGHQQYMSILSTELRTLEMAMEACDRRLYTLLLESENLSWIKEDAKNPDLICDEPETSSILLCPPSPRKSKHKSKPSEDSDEGKPSSPTSESLGDFDPEAAKRQHHINQLVSYVTPSSQNPPSLTHRINSNIFRTLISRSPSLFVRARSKDYPDIETFLQEGDLSLSELNKLSRKLIKGTDPSIGPEMIRNAIADCYRDDKDETDRIKLCGDWLWSKPNPNAMGIEAWRYFHSHNGCANCCLAVTRTFEEWITFRRYTVIGPLFPRWIHANEHMSEKILRVFGLICAANDVGKKSIERLQLKNGATKSLYVEKQTRNWVLLKLSLRDTNAKIILDGLSSNETFTILARNRFTGVTVRKPSENGATWISRVRASKTRTWGNQLIFLEDNLDALSSRSPECRFKKQFHDVFEVIVFDQIHGPFLEFMDRIAKVVWSSVGYLSVEDALAKESATLHLLHLI
ncbi:hypothetical protein SISSUDRAFT_1064509 [Sistotremastrum suecicum HHB10207 ss-3]|uniref:Uncharacterized protein n=1 Tax=Sistotremastrum suecicum HHB10207 ss-3 TaxID=1314776 RepID=A0A166AKF0_9AGAM|nr:hypothetical protein SISSUDRAFT_1064509 [Sistotremastrum suecicum HHB10207 ss-3]